MKHEAPYYSRVCWVGSRPFSSRNKCRNSHTTQSSACSLHTSIPPSSEDDLICSKGGKEHWLPLVPGVIQWGITLPWTACHTWSTGSLCGPSAATCGAAACRGGRKPCHTLCTDKSFPNGNCGRVSWPGIADDRIVEFIQIKICVVKQSQKFLAKKKKHLISGLKINSS